MTLAEILNLSGGGFIVFSALCTIACIWCRKEIEALEKEEGKSELGLRVLKTVKMLRRDRLPALIIGVALFLLSFVLKQHNTDNLSRAHSPFSSMSWSGFFYLEIFSTFASLPFLKGELERDFRIQPQKSPFRKGGDFCYIINYVTSYLPPLRTSPS